MSIETTVACVVLLVLFPFVVFYSVKMGTFAFYRGRFLATRNEKEDHEESRRG